MQCRSLRSRSSDEPHLLHLWPVGTKLAIYRHSRGKHLSAAATITLQGFCAMTWSYVKIHHNPGPSGETTDRILCEAVAPSLREMRNEGLYDAYFFLRYIDETGPHVRLRTNKEALESRLRDSIALRLAGVAPDSQITPARYEPEVAKYGGVEGMALAEAQFHASSEFALACLARTRRHTGVRLLIGARELLWILEAAVAEPQWRGRVLAGYADYWKRFLENSLREPPPLLE